MRHLLKEFLNNNEPSIATAIDYYLLEYLQGSSVKGTLADSYIEKLNTEGFLVIENFWEQKLCDRICEEMDKIFDEHQNFVQIKGDSRLFGIECVSEQINKFKADPLLAQIANQYYQEDSTCIFSLGGKLEYTKNEIKSSGGGWHRDSFGRQFKAMLYLTDVDNENGAFQIIKNSEKITQIVEDMQVANLKYNQNRIDDEQVQMLINKSPERLITFTKPKGTLILFDSTTIHRGSPIQKGARYSLTNYYYPITHINKDMLKHFSPNMYFNSDYTGYWDANLYNDNEGSLHELFKLGKYEDVVDGGWSVEDTIEQNFYKGKSYKQLHDFLSAIECFKLYLDKIDSLYNLMKYRAVLSSAHISSIHFHLGECYLEQRDYESAKKHLVACLVYSNYENEKCKQLLSEFE